jgi:transposase InsO family protein
VKYAFIHTHRKRYGVGRLCQRLSVSKSGYYAWLKDPLGKRGRENAMLKRRIFTIFSESKRIYGSPRIHAKMRKEGYICSRKRVARLMREMGLRSIIKRKYKATTNSRHNKPVAKNKLNRQFRPLETNQIWAGDITFVPTDEGWLYLAIVMDLHSRKIIGWSMSTWIKADLVIQALESAIAKREPRPGLLFHSDQGVQYASGKFSRLLEKNGIHASMSRKGNCYDNAVVESFFNSLKQEWLHHRRFATRDEARQSIFEYIECFYNRHRLHSTLGYRSPEEYEMLNEI